jgi:glycosyltransferase involved in cell wall biosynthesis
MSSDFTDQAAAGPQSLLAATLHVDLGRDWRGGQGQALLLMQGLLRRGHKAELVAVRGSPLAAKALAGGIPVHHVMPRAPRLHAAILLRKLLGRGRAGLVHCHDAHALTAAWLAGAHRRASVVASRRLAFPLSRNPWGLARYRSARRIAAVSCFVRESVLASGLPPDQVEVVYDGVELPPVPSPEEKARARRAWSPDSQGALVGCVGYLLPEKGQEALVRAMPIVLQARPGSRLLLAGDGPCRPHLERLAAELGVERAVRFAGHVVDVVSVYRALDAFVFPSLAEPLGSSLLAAMAHGLPCVAVARGAVPEIIEDGLNGLLAQAPEPSELASRVILLLEDMPLRLRLGEAARQTIERRFTADHMVEATIDLYRRILRG